MRSERFFTIYFKEYKKEKNNTFNQNQNEKLLIHIGYKSTF